MIRLTHETSQEKGKTVLLQEKVVIVTGIGPGMGRKLALEAGKAGARLVLAARSRDFVESVAREVGDTAIAVTADVSKQGDCDRIAAAAIERFGRIDGLVNSAYGSAPFTPFEEADLADWRRAMDVTVFGTLQMVKSALPHMKTQGGSIVNVSTMETRKNPARPWRIRHLQGRTGRRDPPARS